MGQETGHDFAGFLATVPPQAMVKVLSRAIVSSEDLLGENGLLSSLRPLAEFISFLLHG